MHWRLSSESATRAWSQGIHIAVFERVGTRQWFHYGFAIVGVLTIRKRSTIGLEVIQSVSLKLGTSMSAIPCVWSHSRALASSQRLTRKLTWTNRQMKLCCCNNTFFTNHKSQPIDTHPILRQHAEWEWDGGVAGFNCTTTHSTKGGKSLCGRSYNQFIMHKSLYKCITCAETFTTHWRYVAWEGRCFIS